MSIYERKHGLSTFPVSAYVGSSKNLKEGFEFNTGATTQRASKRLSGRFGPPFRFGPSSSSGPIIGGHRNWFCRKAMLPCSDHSNPTVQRIVDRGDSGHPLVTLGISPRLYGIYRLWGAWVILSYCIFPKIAPRVKTPPIAMQGGIAT